MYEYTEEDQSSDRYWLKLTGVQYRYSPLEPFNRGSLGLIEDVPYPLLEHLEKEELIELVRGLKRREDELTTEMRALRKEFFNLKERVGTLLPQSKIIMIEEVTPEEAKNRIYKYIKLHEGGVKTTQIAEELHLNLEVILSSLAELRKEGKIGKVSPGD